MSNEILISDDKERIMNFIRERKKKEGCYVPRLLFPVVGENNKIVAMSNSQAVMNLSIDDNLTKEMKVERAKERLERFRYNTENKNSLIGVF